ncbi:MAG: hypothetical protein FWC96_04030 [Oscillospiraceae bacterium]|nr:hypothetical protein [Oscillospiraceae bacterium]
MKRFLIISVTVILILALTGCGQNSETDLEIEAAVGVITDLETDAETVEWQEESVAASDAPDTLRFSSLEEFLLSYIAVKDGMRAEGFMPTSVHGNFEHFSEMAESVDLLSLERFYLPVNIPEEYKIFRIAVTEYHVTIRFLPEEHLGSETDILLARADSQDFQFSFTRKLNLENPMAGIMEQFGVTEADLIDGKYLFLEPNLFLWGSNREILSLYTPRPPAVGLSDNGEEDLVQFTEMFVLDLTDEEAIWAILASLPSYSP